MPTIDELMKRYMDGELTRGELFAHLVSILSPENIDTVMERVQGEPELNGPLFEEWLVNVARGAQVFVEKRSVPLSASAQAAIDVWQKRHGEAVQAASGGPHADDEAHQGQPRRAGQRRVFLVVPVAFGAAVRRIPQGKSRFDWTDTDVYSRASTERTRAVAEDVDVFAAHDRPAGAWQDRSGV